ncbi:Hypothetical_protein [Hexamita inflata]|uniref:Hypothetical_protein n=1 Tax=Hexamita inflata TaxID=28002 RepID=A0AA86RKT0_9EUKA|nr:Hypothetical protein HINF_LOCUS64061 [Hexamita inflata]
MFGQCSNNSFVGRDLLIKYIKLQNVANRFQPLFAAIQIYLMALYQIQLTYVNLKSVYIYLQTEKMLASQLVFALNIFLRFTCMVLNIYNNTNAYFSLRCLKMCFCIQYVPSADRVVARLEPVSLHENRAQQFNTTEYHGHIQYKLNIGAYCIRFLTYNILGVAVSLLILS